MRIAFVGVKRKYLELPENYRDAFNRYHLELPFYFARDGANEVTVSTVDYRDGGRELGKGFLRCVTESELKKSQTKFDVVVHWRKWFPDLYRPEAINVLNCQDHSFSGEWVAAVRNAVAEKKLRRVLCFPTWHKRNLMAETGLDEEHVLAGVTLGVDTDIYRPSPKKDFHRLLWASDPGRGLAQTLQVFQQLFRADQRFRLHVCYPDYVPPQMQVGMPGVVWEGNVSNGQRLWDLFNECGVLPYASTFMEPSSRAHRQAQAAGSLVLYPPSMGSPSELICGNPSTMSGVTGVVAQVDTWSFWIKKLVESGEAKLVGMNAREMAVKENWSTQAKRFNVAFEEMLGCR